MVFSHRLLALSLPFIALLPNVMVNATPLNSNRGTGSIDLNLFRRQDPGPSSTADASGIEPEDEDPAQILADGTDALRRGT